jgi:hypothetical protein
VAPDVLGSWNTIMSESLARELCQFVDWSRPELTDSPAAKAWHANDPVVAANRFIRRLRARRYPRIGYDRAYVSKLRKAATPAFKKQARQRIEKLLYTGFMGSDHPDGRGTLLHARPEDIQIAATRDDFLHYARILSNARGDWEKTAHHTIMGLTRLLQAVFPIEECPDEAILPILTFLAVKMEVEWAWARNWNEVMLGTTGHNWWIAQLGTTWKAGFLFPEFKGFSRFQALFPTYVERELRVLMYPDGFTHECSVSYHLGTVDLFLDVHRLASLNGLKTSDQFNELLRRCAEVEWKLVCPDGNFPAFGDCGRLDDELFQRAPSIAAMMQIPESKFIAEKMATKRPAPPLPLKKMMIESLNYPSVGVDLLPAYRRLKARAPSAPDTALAESGYYVMRENWTRQSDYCAIEASGRGNLVTSHGHGAIFDLQLYAKGRPILVGNFKGPDGTDEPPRAWRVGSSSHNVVTVDRQDHVPLRSVYRFNQVVVPTVDDWITHKKFAYFSGVHEAYERLER